MKPNLLLTLFAIKITIFSILNETHELIASFNNYTNFSFLISNGNLTGITSLNLDFTLIYLIIYFLIRMQ